MNLLFLLWIVIIILPLISDFEGFGIKVKTPFSELDEKVNQIKADNEFEQLKMGSDSTNNIQDDIESIEKKLEQITKNEVTK